MVNGRYVLQTRAPWTEVKSARMTKSCLAGCKRSFGPRDQESPKSRLRLCKRGLRPCNPMLHQCSKQSAPTSIKNSCALSKALWARSVDLTSVPGGLFSRYLCLGLHIALFCAGGHMYVRVDDHSELWLNQEEYLAGNPMEEAKKDSSC